MKDEHDLASPHTDRNHRQASDMNVLTALSPLSLPRRLDLLAELEEVIDISLRKRHADGIQHARSASCWAVERRHDARLARILART